MSQANTDNSTTECKEPRSAIEEVHDGLFELETLVFSLRNLAYAIRMMASSDEMPKDPGAALDSVSDKLVNDLNYLVTERERLLGLAMEGMHPPKPDKARAA